jgi:nickel transport protein
MKSLVRWSTTVALVGAAALGSILAGSTRVLALTPEQITQKLRSIPVFTLANSQGALIVSTPEGQSKTSVAGAFISQKQAQAYLENLKKQNPNLAKDVRVVPVSLAEVYQIDRAGQGKPNDLDFDFVPTKQQVDAAVALLKQSGQQVNQFTATPMFMLAEKKGNEVGYLVVERNKQKGIPVFFDKELAQSFLQQLQKQPNGAKGVQIQVVTLEGVMKEMQAAQKDPKRNEFLSQIEFVPSAESIQFLQSLRSQQRPAQQGQPRPSQPQQRPAPAQPKR